MAFEMGLSCEDVTVQRGGRDVLGPVTVALSAGEALQLRGSNGSGKTSLLRAIAGLASFEGAIEFQRSEQRLDAAYIRQNETHFVGLVSGLAPRLTVGENVRFQSSFYGQDPRDGLEQLGLAKLRDRKVGTLSSGQQRRLSLLRLLMDPRALWLLDEPLAALDDEGQLIVRTLIDVHRERGGIVVVALHDSEGLPRAKTLRVMAS